MRDRHRQRKAAQETFGLIRGRLSRPRATARGRSEAEQFVRRPDLRILTTEVARIRGRLAQAASTPAGSSTLTGAELGLLPFLPTYLLFQEIGDRWSISRHAVKTHAMSIAGELQESSRGSTVEPAIELGLLEPDHDLMLHDSPPAA